MPNARNRNAYFSSAADFLKLLRCVSIKFVFADQLLMGNMMNYKVPILTILLLSNSFSPMVFSQVDVDKLAKIACELERHE